MELSRFYVIQSGTSRLSDLLLHVSSFAWVISIFRFDQVLGARKTEYFKMLQFHHGEKLSVVDTFRLAIEEKSVYISAKFVDLKWTATVS